MTGQEYLGSIALVISICVIIGIAFMFSFLFAIYGKYKIKHINYGHEDLKLEGILRKRYADIIRKNEEKDLNPITIKDSRKDKEPDYVMVQDMRNVKTFTLVGEKEVEKPLEPVTVLGAILEEKRKSKKWRIASNVFFAIFYVLLLILLGYSIAFKVTNQQLYVGNSGLVAIYTGSMETMNDKNDYLIEQGLEGEENRIMQYSLIGVDKITSPDEMELYKIYGYRTDKGALIFHRLIRIYTNPESNITYYTFRGDANSVSSDYELALTFDSIECVYNGFQNFGLGVASIYFQSNIGLITMLAAFLFLLSYQVTESLIDSTYDKRTQEIAKKIDGKEYVLDLRNKKMKKVEEKL